MFESEFLTPTQATGDLYQRLISQAAQVVRSSLPNAPYQGQNASALAGLINPNFLPDTPCSPEQIAIKGWP